MVRRSIPAVLWGPFVVGLAYLPDILSQAVTLLGGGNVSYITHSVCFAIIISLAIGAGLARLRTTSFRGGTVICLFSILMHDGMDVMQSTNRQPWWPLSDRAVGFSENPIGPLREVVLFGLAFALFMGAWSVRNRRRIRQTPETNHEMMFSTTWHWINRLLMGLILLAACGTHYLRSLRELAYEEVRREIHEGHYEAALAAADRAERWPSTAKPGRLDCARGEIFAALGDRPRADAAFERGLAADPHYFWGLADAAAFYAGSDEPASVRQAKVQPFLDQLKEEFADHEAWPRQLERIELRLRQPSTQSAGQVAP